MSDPAPVCVRRARSADAAEVARHWIALSESHAAQEPLFALRPGAAGEVAHLVEAQLRDPDVWIGLAERGAQLLGSCIVRVDLAPPIHAETQRGEITDLYVEPLQRRAGVGRALVQAADRWLRGRGVSRVEVRVVVQNAAGRAFWQAAGFAPFVNVLHRHL
jgi:GNAT superfamily N-acetyltransferase